MGYLRVFFLEVVATRMGDGDCGFKIVEMMRSSVAMWNRGLVVRQEPLIPS
jgi:hypothetical protein